MENHSVGVTGGGGGGGGGGERSKGKFSNERCLYCQLYSKVKKAIFSSIGDNCCNEVYAWNPYTCVCVFFFRESLRSASHECMDTGTRSGRRRHRRRQTVSGLPQHVHSQLSHAFFNEAARDREARSLSGDRLDRPRSMAYLDRYAMLASCIFPFV